MMITAERWPVYRTGERDPIEWDIRRAVYARDGFRCVWCGRDEPLTLDHITPWSAGGSDDSRNLRTLCWPCNERRSNYRTWGAPKDHPLPVAPWCEECWPTTRMDPAFPILAYCVDCGVNGYTGCVA